MTIKVKLSSLESRDNDVMTVMTVTCTDKVNRSMVATTVKKMMFMAQPKATSEVGLNRKRSTSQGGVSASPGLSSAAAVSFPGGLKVVVRTSELRGALELIGL